MNKKKNSSDGITATVMLIIILIIGYYFFNWIGGIGKYQGWSAEEWAEEAYYWEDRYYEFRSCVEDFDDMNVLEQIDYGGVFYYCE